MVLKAIKMGYQLKSMMTLCGWVMQVRTVVQARQVRVMAWRGLGGDTLTLAQATKLAMVQPSMVTNSSGRSVLES